MEHKLQSALKKYEKSILSKNNVCGVGIGKKMVRAASTNDSAPMSIVVLVKKKLPEDKLRKQDVIPKTLDGLPTDVIEIGEVKLQASRTEKHKKIQPGVSIGHYKITAGTLGAIVKDKKTGKLMILSNNHVLANGSNGKDGRSRLGDSILQPGPHDGGLKKDEVAKLHRFVPVYRTMITPTCTKASSAESLFNLFVKKFAPFYEVKVMRQSNKGNLVDAALAMPNDPNSLNSEIIELGNVKGITQAKTGMKILKSGRTTGVTKGEVKAVNVSLTVDMGDNTEALFKDQILATAMSQGGDSGSLVVDEKNRAVGLLFAGSDKVTLINKIQNVMDKLSITF